MAHHRRPFTSSSSSSTQSVPRPPTSASSRQPAGYPPAQDYYPPSQYQRSNTAGSAESYESETDADVFAYGPPSTANGGRGDFPPTSPYGLEGDKYIAYPESARPRTAATGLQSLGYTSAGGGKRWSDGEGYYESYAETYEDEFSSGAGEIALHRPGTQDGLDKVALELELEEDSPYPEVRASVSNTDDPDIPVMTFRMWLIGGVFCAIAGAINTIFNFRYPAPGVTPIVIQLMTYPVGKLLAYILPMDVYTVPRWLGGWTFTLNPGPFNIKEHTLITIMANVSVSPAYALNVTVVSELFYGHTLGIACDILLLTSSQCIGFGMAGFCRRFVVWPASMLWPQCLVVCTLLNTFHAEDDGHDGSMTRFKFFFIIGSSAVIWYFVPGFFFKALSWFSWVCWIWPRSPTVNQLFGTFSGLGMGCITFDWSQIAYIGSPLVMPWWAECNVAIGFLVFYWIIAPILYYTNVYSYGYMPMSDSNPYDRYGQQYNITRVVTEANEFNATAYAEYSPLYLSVTYSMVYLLAYMLTTAVLTHTALYHGKAIWDGIRNVKNEDDDIHAKLMRAYPEVPNWWYLAFLVSSIALAIGAVGGWDLQMPIWGLLIALLIPAVYLLPAAFIYAMTGQELAINLVAEVVPGYLFPGRPIANMVFKSYAVQTMGEGLSFTQDLKLGHYIKIPPRATFTVQCLGTFVSAVIQVGVRHWIFNSIPGICSPRQTNNFTCPSNRVYYTSSVIWGLIGPDKMFGQGALYHYQLWFLLVGALLPVPVFLWIRRRPRSIFRNLNWPVLLTGPTWIPPATGINYSSWIIVGFIFQYLLRRTHFAWWSKYNFILSAALDTGTVVGIILVFLLLQLPKHGTVALRWWGNTVFTNTADYLGMPSRTPPSTGFGSDTWKS